MKKILTALIISLGILTSCSTTYVVKNYPQDGVYYSSKEDYQIDTQNTVKQEPYEEDNYYDYSYTARIRRFHSPHFYSSYYSDYYTDLYWYNYDPFYYGTSIYSTYNWLWPNYGYFYYGYIPSYYYWHYYPNYWYLGNVYLGYPYYHYGWFHHNHWNHNWYVNNLNNVYYGPRGHHMTTTNNGMNIRLPRTSQGGKIGKIAQNPQPMPKNDQKYQTPRYQKPEQRNNENYKNPSSKPKNYTSPQYTQPRSSQEYVSPSVEKRIVNLSDRKNYRESAPQQRTQPRYTPTPAPQRSTPSTRNSGRSAPSPRATKTR